MFTYWAAIDALLIVAYWIMYLFISKKKLGYAVLILIMLAVCNVVLTIEGHGGICVIIGVWLYSGLDVLGVLM